ncbi:hypothetical protein DSO57_1014221 [Entomophthora muscae]|uniref:Uncharacterized protein n=1 Tax=Entomophthora muscae TaxID=34485 RepID=A0ACC2SUX5_9FUNG|nr:hypothetical protein DSO57_1014221 [Entomophthora muscae]
MKYSSVLISLLASRVSANSDCSTNVAKLSKMPKNCTEIRGLIHVEAEADWPPSPSLTKVAALRVTRKITPIGRKIKAGALGIRVSVPKVDFSSIEAKEILFDDAHQNQEFIFDNSTPEYIILSNSDPKFVGINYAALKKVKIENSIVKKLSFDIETLEHVIIENSSVNLATLFPNLKNVYEMEIKNSNVSYVPAHSSETLSNSGRPQSHSTQKQK